MYTYKKEWSLETNESAVIIGVGTEDAGLPDALTHGTKDLHDLLNKKYSHIKKQKGKVISFTVPSGSEWTTLIFVGKGDDTEISSLKEALGAGFQAASDDAKVAVLIDTFTNDRFDSSDVAQVAAEMGHVSTYTFDAYKTNKQEKPDQSITFYTNGEANEAAIVAGTATAKGVNLARTLVNIPANDLTPVALAGEARALASRFDHFSFDVLGNEQLEEMGMDALLSVNKGSDLPAQMIVLRYQGQETWSEPLTFVGKGLTYDTGGYSLKPADGMKTMKSDMGGAASVLGAMEVVGHLQPDVNVMAVIPSTENMVNGQAMRPGDVIGSFDGQTIEVTNTDAEGRLALADGVSYAKHLGAAKIVDVATLTGACVVALGDVVTGSVSNNDDFYAQAEAAAKQSGEAIWRFPTHPHYYEMLKQTDVADLNNAPGRLAGSITAGLFIQSFVKDTPWVHLDIAGTSFLDRVTPMGPKGGTGVMVRTLATMALDQ